ncbi:hypothetical protein [Izhakiella australiensis]|uniref:hypothetical protein n=1 Tax=Izhakiella australiensis TaxID=1926881 RepID=UPI00098EE8F0|nr:hypothetical protein [Izhakiella australiensis]
MICSYCEHGKNDCEHEKINASTVAVNVSTRGFSFAVNVSKKADKREHGRFQTRAATLIYQDRRNLSKHKQMMLPVLSTISVTGGITAPHLAALALQLERIKTMVEFKKNSWG